MERNVLVDRLKGYACFLVLFGHVIMGIRLAGIDIPGFFVGIEKFIWSFHVALFLFLSGVVYKVTGEWKSKKTKWGFLLYKLYNLGIPYIAFSVIYILINSLVGEANTGFAPSDILQGKDSHCEEGSVLRTIDSHCSHRNTCWHLHNAEERIQSV